MSPQEVASSKKTDDGATILLWSRPCVGIQRYMSLCISLKASYEEKV